MDTYTLKVNEENIRKTFEEDALGRNEYVLGLVKWINTIDNSAILSLEGDWGSGKTFLLKQLELLYENENIINSWKNKPNNINLSDFNFDDAKVLYYDSWENDGAENPLLNLVYNLAISADINIDTKKLVIDKDKVIDYALDKFKTLNPVFEVIDFIKKCILSEENDIFDNIKHEGTIKNTISLFINKIKEKYTDKKIVIIIDELDRCRPEFALKIVESIKHYFDEKGIIVILSINPKEMQSIIKKYYGDSIDETLYLDKVIDVHLQVPKLNVSDYIKYILGNVNNSSLVYHAMITVIKKYGLNMRQINRYLGALKVVLREDILIGFTAPNGLYEVVTPLYVTKIYLPIYLIGIYNIDNELYMKVINGNAKKIFINDFFFDKNNIIYYRITSLAQCINKHVISDENIEKCKDWLDNMYDNFFNNKDGTDDKDDYITHESKKLLFNTISLISLNEKYSY